MTEPTNYQRIEKAIHFLTANFKQQPSLDEVAERVNLSPFHFQRIFTEWAGISPKKFLQYLTLEELKKELHQTENLIYAAEKVGLSAQSRVYDLFVNIESMTPQEYKLAGKGIQIEFGFHGTPFGEMLIAQTSRGICSLSFTENNHDDLIEELHESWNLASVHQNQHSTKLFSELLFQKNQSFNLFVRGTKFQIKVWEALLKIPFGSVSSYQSIAKNIQNPDAVRAVGSAIGHNPVAFLIPCHRVIRSEGIIGQYHWGNPRKAALIGWEKAQLELKKAV